MTLFKKFLILITFLQLYLFLTPLPALAYSTYHVAVVPLINTANCQDEEVLGLIQTKIKNKFKFPFYEIIPTETVTAAVQKDISTKMKDKAAMEELAKDISADIIIGIELVHAQSVMVTPSLWSFYSDDDTYLDTRVLIKCHTYSIKDGQYLSFKASISGLEPMRIDTSLYHSVEKAMDQLMGKLPYKRVPDDALTQKVN